MTSSPQPRADSSHPGGEIDQDVQAAALKANKIAQLEAKIAAVQVQIEEVKAKKEKAYSQLKSPSTATQTVQNHIHLLHIYNQIRDIGTGLFGMIADNKGVQVKDVYGDFGLCVGD
ncbi:hypothetical protein MMC08_007758 [Hypocenomyce scalaris]|nr:hypothetical protein [Hypocenomyce scalaris]